MAALRPVRRRPKTAIQIDGGALVEFATAGLYRLRDAIRGTGVGAETRYGRRRTSRPRPVPGREPLRNDAAVFYGRDAALVRGLDALRTMRLRVSGMKSIFVVLGPSGAGKSSFLRAGLLPRLRREDVVSAAGHRAPRAGRAHRRRRAGRFHLRCAQGRGPDRAGPGRYQSRVHRGRAAGIGASEKYSAPRDGGC